MRFLFLLKRKTEHRSDPIYFFLLFTDIKLPPCSFSSFRQSSLGSFSGSQFSVRQVHELQPSRLSLHLPLFGRRVPLSSSSSSNNLVRHLSGVDVGCIGLFPPLFQCRLPLFSFLIFTW
ncbi:uncharacterized protein LOC129287767 [Prosopis cineraria]|uniref:uncharacterized protein LOC129287767 n=1 Tax=Prosopis cineraria TaxID=364024 RepID=UPI00240FB899|nr:uncharacterized protein LOC129287767 [Prosopis cineraria]